MLRHWIAGGALMLALSIMPAQAQKAVANPPDLWAHAATGVQFPAKAAGFERTRVTEFSEDGRDAGVSYRLNRGDQFVAVTLYVYPAWADATCPQVFTDARSHIEKYKGARVVREGRELPPSGQGAPAAHYARYAVPEGGMRADSPAVTTDVYLHCPAGGEWLVKYRATGSEGFEFGPDVTRLLRAISWPAGLRR